MGEQRGRRGEGISQAAERASAMVGVQVGETALLLGVRERALLPG